MSTLAFHAYAGDGADDFEDTRPAVSAWAAPGAEMVKANAVWCIRCASRLIEVQRELRFEQAHDFARELARDDRQRSRTPELVAEDFVRNRLVLE